MVEALSNQPNMTSDLKLRFIHHTGQAAREAGILNASLHLRGILYEDCYVPNYNKALIIYKFKNLQDKNALLNHPDLSGILQRKNFSHYTPPTTTNTDKESERTAFVWRLNPLMFLFSTSHELNESKRAFKNSLVDYLRDNEMPINANDIQFIHHPDLNPPKQCRIKFQTKAHADKFVAFDSRFLCYYLPKIFKKIDVHIPIPQCKDCRKKSHPTGHSDCDGVKRCPRCLSRNHLAPLDDDPRNCPPYCWTHKEGHSTGSGTCPDNRNYRKQKRNEMKINTERENIINNTDPAYRQIHTEMFNIRQDVKYIKASKTTPKPGPSYADATLGRAAAMKTLPDFSPPGYAQAFLGAMLMSVYDPDPNTFEKVMNDYETRNGWSVIKHPPILPSFLAALSEQEPAIPEQFIPSSNLAPRTENTPQSRGSVKRPRLPKTTPSGNLSPQGAQYVSPNSKASRLDLSRIPDLNLPKPLDPRGPAPSTASKPSSSKHPNLIDKDYLDHMEIANPPPTPKSPETRPDQPKPQRPTKDRNTKAKTSPNSQKLAIKKIRDALAKTSESPIGISIQHDASAPNHPGPKRLVKELKWREDNTGEHGFPKMSLYELYEHIRCNRVLYTPPVQIGGLNLKVIESLVPDYPNETLHYCLEPKYSVTSTTGRVINMPSSRTSSPQRP